MTEDLAPALRIPDVGDIVDAPALCTEAEPVCVQPEASCVACKLHPWLRPATCRSLQLLGLLVTHLPLRHVTVHGAQIVRCAYFMPLQYRVN